MLNRLKRRDTLLSLLLILVGLTLVVFFGLRALRAFRHVREGPRETDVALIQEWMTIHYVAHVYKVPPDYIFAQLGISESENRNKSMAELNEAFAAAESGMILAQVKAIIQQFQAEHSAPEPPGPRHQGADPSPPSHE